MEYQSVLFVPLGLLLLVTGSLGQIFSIQCYACSDCEFVSRDTPKCSSAAQNPAVSHSIGFTFPDQGIARSCIKIRDEDGIYHRGCHNAVASDCVYVEGIEACYCTGHLCNSGHRSSVSISIALSLISASLCAYFLAFL